MIYGSEYPEQRYVISKTTLRRQVYLPDNMNGTVLVNKGNRVDANTVVVRGQLPSHHTIVEAARALRLRKPDDLNAMLLVDVGDFVEEGQPLAGRNPNRGRRAFAPVSGIVVGLDNGRIVLKKSPEEIDLVAGMHGLVVGLREGRGVIIETSGGVIQGVWGNNGRAIGAMRWEPEAGIHTIKTGEINLEWRGTVVMVRTPLTYRALAVITAAEISGVIAPSMDSTLVDVALKMKPAILLTEGFGDMRFSNVVNTMLTELMSKHPNLQCTIDAVAPTSLLARRPEVLINVPIKEGEEPAELQMPQQLRTGMSVRITRRPYQGQIGRINEIPHVPVTLENGLRVPSAFVELAGGEIVPIPIANLELFAS